jgi:hypothetical protein
MYCLVDGVFGFIRLGRGTSNSGSPQDDAAVGRGDAVAGRARIVRALETPEDIQIVLECGREKGLLPLWAVVLLDAEHGRLLLRLLLLPLMLKPMSVLMILPPPLPPMLRGVHCCIS